MNHFTLSASQRFGKILCQEVLDSCTFAPVYARFFIFAPSSLPLWPSALKAFNSARMRIVSKYLFRLAKSRRFMHSSCHLLLSLGASCRFTSLSLASVPRRRSVWRPADTAPLLFGQCQRPILAGPFSSFWAAPIGRRGVEDGRCDDHGLSTQRNEGCQWTLRSR